MIWKTAFLSILLVFLAYLAGAWLTYDFAVWTAEGARRLQIARSPVSPPNIAMRGPDLPDSTTLAGLLVNEGGATVVDFVYTRCPTVCRALGSTFQQLQANIKMSENTAVAKQGGIKLLTISFDPGHDSTTALSAYANQLKADPTVWKFATPANEKALQTLLDRFGVVVISDGMGGYEHNAALLVMNDRGQLVRIFDLADLDAALVFAQGLAVPKPPR